MEYTTEQLELLAKFDELIGELGSQNKACKAIGISAGVMSELKNGTYKGNSEVQFEKIANYFKMLDEKKDYYVAKEYLPTSISERVRKDIRYVQLKGGLGVLAGDAGVGKTRGIKKFKKDNPHKTIWVTANPCLNSVKPILKRISSELGITSKTNDEMYLNILSKLNDGDVIIIDEAQHLSTKVIETLRGFTDYFADRGQNLAVVFVGNQTTMDRFGGRKEASFEQIENRTVLKSVYKTSDVTKEDIKILIPLVEDDMSLEFLHKIAQSRQAIRGAMNVFTNAYDNYNYSYQGLVEMTKHLKINI